MKYAVMQPYIFPYIGYFQMLNAVDTFVFYDDVNFIKQGWINRNKILLNQKENIFTIPLQKISSFTEIKDTLAHPVLYNQWKRKFLKSLELSYKKAPYHKAVFPLIEKILNTPTDKISVLAEESVRQIAGYMGMETQFRTSSIDFPETKGMDKADRLIAIGKKLYAAHYINALGGKELYDKTYFKEQGIKLDFINPQLVEYQQLDNDFIPGLSMIDVLMFNSKERINNMLTKYTLE